MGLFGPMEADFGSKRGNFGPERGDFRSERVDLGRIGPISGLKEPDLGLSGLGGGGRTDGRTDVRTDGRKEIHPCVLQDIGPLGPLPKKDQEEKIVAKALHGQRYPMPCWSDQVK